MRDLRWALPTLPLTLLCWTPLALAEADGPLTIADLPAYRAALDHKTAQEPATRVSFRDLWERPDEFRGRRVAVSGRVVLVFHKGRVGQFPPLTEVWIFTEASDPFCLICPESIDKLATKPGGFVEFEGTSLRRVRYQSGDVDRLAPLIVGAQPPRIHQPAPKVSKPSDSPFDGLFLLVMAGIVALTLARGMLRRPRTGAIVADPPPMFHDGASSDSDP